MHDTRVRSPAVEHRAVAIPAHPPLAAAADHFPPQPEEPIAKSPKRRAVTRYGVVLVIATQNTPQPLADLRQRLMHPAAKLLLDLLQFCSHPFAGRLAPDDEAALLEPTVMRESQEVEALRLSLAAFSAVGFSVTSELDESCFLWVQLQPELRQPFLERSQKSFGVVTVLEAQHQIVSVANDDYIALRPALPPDLYPLIKDIMQIDVR